VLVYVSIAYFFISVLSLGVYLYTPELYRPGPARSASAPRPRGGASP
jgi:hypothetical protein